MLNSGSCSRLSVVGIKIRFLLEKCALDLKCAHVSCFGF